MKSSYKKNIELSYFLLFGPPSIISGSAIVTPALNCSLSLWSLDDYSLPYFLGLPLLRTCHLPLPMYKLNISKLIGHFMPKLVCFSLYKKKNNKLSNVLGFDQYNLFVFIDVRIIHTTGFFYYWVWVLGAVTGWFNLGSIFTTGSRIRLNKFWALMGFHRKEA